MAELVIYTQDIGTYENGDIVGSFNDRRISSVHCQEICHVKFNLFNGDGLNQYGLSQIMEETCSQYKFERLSAKVIRRTNLITSESEELSNIPNAKGEYIDVPLYIRRRLQHDRHRIYGVRGSEVWYGGRFNDNAANLNAVWVEIESRTAYRKVNFLYSPLTDAELKAFLAISTDDFTDDAGLDAPKTEEQLGEQVIIEKRANKVDWKLLPGILTGSIATIADIEDDKIKVDIRNQATYLVDNIVQVKS